MVLGRGIKNHITSTGYECESCVLLREWLEQQTEEKRYYQQLALKQAGLLNQTEEENLNTAQDMMPSIRKGYTLSGLKRELEGRLSQKARNPTVVVASGQSLTEAEQVFDSMLENEYRQAASK